MKANFSLTSCLWIYLEFSLNGVGQKKGFVVSLKYTGARELYCSDMLPTTSANKEVNITLKNINIAESQLFADLGEPVFPV